MFRLPFYIQIYTYYRYTYIYIPNGTLNIYLDSRLWVMAFQGIVQKQGICAAQHGLQYRRYIYYEHRGKTLCNKTSEGEAELKIFCERRKKTGENHLHGSIYRIENFVQDIIRDSKPCKKAAGKESPKQESIRDRKPCKNASGKESPIQESIRDRKPCKKASGKETPTQESIRDRKPCIGKFQGQKTQYRRASGIEILYRRAYRI